MFKWSRMKVTIPLPASIFSTADVHDHTDAVSGFLTYVLQVAKSTAVAKRKFHG